MTAQDGTLRFADAREVADLGAFLARLIHYDRAAAVRIQAGGGALAVFGRPASFEVIAIRTARLAAPHRLDVTVSAGQLLESLDETGGTVAVPPAVTGPPWAGLLPPRGGWTEVPGLPGERAMHGAVLAAVTEFRSRDEQLTPERRTRAERDRIGREIWSRTLGETELPLRAVHAARSVGFLRPMPDGSGTALLKAGAWLRLRTPYGSIALRTTGIGGLSPSQGLSVTPA